MAHLIGHLQEGGGCTQIEETLVMMFVCCMSDVLLWIFVEGIFAACRTEIVDLSFVFRLSSSSCGIDIHSTDGIFYCICHWFSPFF